MTPAKRVLIFAGGTLGEWALTRIKPGDYVIGADRGAAFLIRHGVIPDLSVGDFDSVSPEEMALIRECGHILSFDPVHKDYTDSELALAEALKLRPDSIVMLGMTGSRLDHTLANVHLLQTCLDAGIDARIVDANNELAATTAEYTVQRSRYMYVSLLPLAGQVTGITLEGFQYPLLDATLTVGQSLGISNELTGETGTIRIKSGTLLVIQSTDG